MYKKKILLIGCGNIGLRHLQALKKIKPKLSIFIYDKNLKKINILKNKNIFVVKNLKQNLKFDLVIIATNSKERFKVFLEAINHNKIKKIIFEKFIFFKKNQFDKTLYLLKKKKIKSWVNCIRREIEIFKKFKSQISGQFELTYNHSNWGLGCNSIHFLDLFAYLSKNKQISIVSKELNRKIYKSSRKGYCEFKGRLKFKSGESLLNIEDNIKFKNKAFIISTNHKKFLFNEQENILTVKNIINNSTKKYKCEQPYVSNTSYKIIKKLINNKKIKLSSFEETISYHKLLINIFSKHLKSINPKNQFMIT